MILHQVENELQETTHSPNNTLVIYMEQAEEALWNASLVIPFTSNEKGERSVSWTTDYEDVGGAVNVYGLDSYPGGFSCTNVNSGFNLVRNYFQWFSNYSFTQPSYFPELEVGYFNSWGGFFYDQCIAEHQPPFADVFVKLMSGSGQHCRTYTWAMEVQTGVKVQLQWSILRMITPRLSEKLVRCRTSSNRPSCWVSLCEFLTNF